jgi:GAF domain-containing protein
MLGYEMDELVGASTRILYQDIDAYNAFGDHAYPFLSSGKVYRSEIKYVSKDGRHIWTDLRGVNIGILSEESLWIFIDITERKAIEQLETYRGKVLELLAIGAPMEDILKSIVCGIESIEPRLIGSILILNKAGKNLHVGAAPQLPDFYNAAIEGMEIGLGAGSCGTVAFTGKRIIVEDIQNHPYWTSYKELAAKAGLSACWSEPILSSSNKVLGTFAIYHRQTNTPTEKDISIIETAAKLASIAIEQKLIKEELIQHQNQLEVLVNSRTADLQSAHARLLDTQFAMEMARICFGNAWLWCR